ncbi:hypothetical protein [Neisseria gonorrhoeae]|uniref:hypothetical protein n=1 Tax=Neisseria gonorrhoeae TaxID=485 RepID=UPI002161C339
MNAVSDSIHAKMICLSGVSVLPKSCVKMALIAPPPSAYIVVKPKSLKTAQSAMRERGQSSKAELQQKLAISQAILSGKRPEHPFLNQADKTRQKDCCRIQNDCA